MSRALNLALDIDNVLADTNLYWAQKLHQQFGHVGGLSPEEIAMQYRYLEDIEGWDSDDAKAWITHARTSNEVQMALPLLHNANHMVNKVHALHPIAAYITGRPERTREGTQTWLTKHEFPPAPLIMRPDAIEHEGWWK